MTAPEKNRGANGQSPEAEHKPAAKSKMPCEEIEPILFDYMNHDLGQARATLVREHIRKCESCRAAAHEIQETLELLKQASADEKKADVHLTEDRRRRVWRAFAHPMLDWAAEHHVVVSTIIAVVVLVLAWVAVRNIGAIWNIPTEPPPPVDTTVEVTIDGHGWTLVPGSNGMHTIIRHKPKE